MKLKEVQILKYKSIETTQSFAVDEAITVIVGMNESGKSAILEALAKSNYLGDDPAFRFNATHDYPRRQKKAIDKSGDDPTGTVLVYAVDADLKAAIADDVGTGVFDQDLVSRTTQYSNGHTWQNVGVDLEAFKKTLQNSIPNASPTLIDKIMSVRTKDEFQEIVDGYKSSDMIEKLGSLSRFYQNDWDWTDPIAEYVARVHLTPALPRFIYYSEYYALPARISLEKLSSGQLKDSESKTAKALIELAEVDLKQILKSEDFEDFKAELEATQAIISDEMFEYWKTNQNLSIDFDVDKIERNDPNNHRIVEHVLDIRVRNSRAGITLPLRNRSKGFNWFFSFLVWFKRIQEDQSSPVILLLDEPGLNLHASAQSDLLDFLTDLSKNYQIVYTTHSPFMIETTRLDRVRTVVETKTGTVISDSIQEKDPNTLFPLQAALGYDIAQNLFVSPKNLLVEGVADLVFLETISHWLNDHGRTGLSPDITIVPVGGLEKVATFISLLRGSKLHIVCALDTISDPRSQSRLDDLSREKIIQSKNLFFFDQFANGAAEADIEDLFDESDYLRLYNKAFPSITIESNSLNSGIPRITRRIAKAIGVDRYNHYLPAKSLVTEDLESTPLAASTFDRFEKLLGAINGRFQ